jgi:hypothetical protein
MSNKTVYVIGAGASKEAGLPTGDELKSTISDLLDFRFQHFGDQTSGDYLIVNALKKIVQDAFVNFDDVNLYIKEARHISEALPLAISIDNFIHSHQGNEALALCGKLAIVRSILQAEDNSILNYDRSNIYNTINFGKLQTTWYSPFFKLLTEECKIDDLEERFKSVVLVIFNYDRCIEHFLCHALQKYYRISDIQAAQLIKCMSIYHPYGSVGVLPHFGNNDNMEFGAEPNAGQLIQLAKKIQTFTEGTDPESSDIIEIRKHMVDARKLVFMGFAFHKLNMELISTDIKPSPVRPGLKCYATAYNISESDSAVISGQISGLYKSKVNSKTVNKTCNDFFSEFWKSLAF